MNAKWLNGRNFIYAIAATIAGTLGYIFFYVPHALESELAQSRQNADEAQAVYNFLDTTLDAYAQKLAEAGELNGHNRDWQTVTEADAESFESKFGARAFLKENRFLLDGAAEDFLTAHAGQVRFDILNRSTFGRDSSSLQWARDSLVLVNRLFEVCGIRAEICEEATVEFEEIGEWYAWFQKSPAAQDYYLKSDDSSMRMSIEPLPKAFVNVCNFATYESRHLVVAVEEGKVRRAGDWFNLEPGECVRRMQVFFKGEPAFYVHSDILGEARSDLQYINDILNRQLRNDDDPSNDRFAVQLSGEEFQAWGLTLACAARQSDLVTNISPVKTVCQRGEYEGRFSQTYALDDSGEWYFFFESPNLYMFEFGGSVATAVRHAQQRARKTARAIHRQQFYNREWRGQFPFSPGGDLADFNGPIMPGVQLTSAASRDLYGRPLGLRSGDIILEINNRPVFGISDANQLLINHGLSREHGIESPVVYSVFRNGQNHRIESAYFFNPRYRSQGSGQSGIAFWYGVGDAVGFGQTPEIVCYGGNVGKFVGNVIAGLVDGAASVINDRPFDKRSLSVFEYHDAGECNWQKHQNRALAMQMDESTYQDSQWFTIISPSAVRMLGSKALQRQARKQLGRTVGSRVSNAALEVLETSLWSMGTEPPGTPIGERLSSVKKLAPIAAAGGAAPVATIGVFATSLALKQNAVGFEGE
ncbi:MAG: PDZ domain-containing protein [Pseudomonadota bacterium]